MNQRDQIYQKPQAAVSDFCFDQQVVQVFPDMINRSVPGYALLVDMIAGIAKNHIKANGLCYDLGCSLGAVSFALRKSITHASARIVAIDNSEAMINRAKKSLPRMDGQVVIDFQYDDILNSTLQPCDFVVMNFTMQFIAREKREALLQKIYNALKPNGILIISEKICFDEVNTQQHLTELHHDFKRNHGYSDLEIAQKRTALENVLLPDTQQEHILRLQQAGFNAAMLWFQCFNFSSFIAFKA